jgi:excisionase family DNA binding protein
VLRGKAGTRGRHTAPLELPNGTRCGAPRRGNQEPPLRRAVVDARLARADTSLVDARRLLDSNTVAKRLGVSPRTMRRWCLEEHVQSQRTLGGHYRITVAELTRLLNIVGQSGQSGQTR